MKDVLCPVRQNEREATKMVCTLSPTIKYIPPIKLLFPLKLPKVLLKCEMGSFKYYEISINDMHTH